MVNALNKNLEGKHIVVSEKYLGGTEAERVFLCTGGFGCSPNTIGKAVFGEFIATGEETRIEGYMVKKFATKKLIAEAQSLREGFDKTKPEFKAEDIKVNEKGEPYVEIQVTVPVKVLTRPASGKRLPIAIGGCTGLIRGTKPDGSYTEMTIKTAVRYWLSQVQPELTTKQKLEEKVGSATREDAFGAMLNFAYFHLLASQMIDEYPITITVPDELHDKFTKREGA